MKFKHNKLFSCVSLACLLLGASSPAHAASELGEILGQVLVNDPLVMESAARVEEADLHIKSTRAQHYPRLSLQSAQQLNTVSPYASATDKGYVALTGRLNLLSFGAINSQVKRDEAKREFQVFKGEETRENLAYNLSSLYLQALRAKDLLVVERRSLDRHQTIVDTLAIIAKYDPGRRSELVQAQARQLQVQNRVQQYERNFRLQMAKLQRYVAKPPEIRNDFENGWRNTIAGMKQGVLAEHPVIRAQRAEMNALEQEVRSQKAAQLPRVELEVQQVRALQGGTMPKPQVRVVLEWNFFNLGSRYTSQSYAKQYAASAARERQLQQELNSRSQMALVDIEETGRQVKSALTQIEANEQVVEMYKLQFKIGRRSLIELLNAHNELSSMETSRANAQNDQRAAMLDLLHSQALLAEWAGRERSGVDSFQQVPGTFAVALDDRIALATRPATLASAPSTPLPTGNLPAEPLPVPQAQAAAALTDDEAWSLAAPPGQLPVAQVPVAPTPVPAAPRLAELTSPQTPSAPVLPPVVEKPQAQAQQLQRPIVATPPVADPQPQPLAVSQPAVLAAPAPSAPASVVVVKPPVQPAQVTAPPSYAPQLFVRPMPSKNAAWPTLHPLPVAQLPLAKPQTQQAAIPPAPTPQTAASAAPFATLARPTPVLLKPVVLVKPPLQPAPVAAPPSYAPQLFVRPMPSKGVAWPILHPLPVAKQPVPNTQIQQAAISAAPTPQMPASVAPFGTLARPTPMLLKPVLPDRPVQAPASAAQAVLTPKPTAAKLLPQPMPSAPALPLPPKSAAPATPVRLVTPPQPPQTPLSAPAASKPVVVPASTTVQPALLLPKPSAPARAAIPQPPQVSLSAPAAANPVPVQTSAAQAVPRPSKSQAADAVKAVQQATPAAVAPALPRPTTPSPQATPPAQPMFKPVPAGTLPARGKAVAIPHPTAPATTSKPLLLQRPQPRSASTPVAE